MSFPGKHPRKKTFLSQNTNADQMSLAFFLFFFFACVPQQLARISAQIVHHQLSVCLQIKGFKILFVREGWPKLRNGSFQTKRKVTSFSLPPRRGREGQEAGGRGSGTQSSSASPWVMGGPCATRLGPASSRTGLVSLLGSGAVVPATQSCVYWCVSNPSRPGSSPPSCSVLASCLERSIPQRLTRTVRGLPCPVKAARRGFRDCCLILYTPGAVNR